MKSGRHCDPIVFLTNQLQGARWKRGTEKVGLQEVLKLNAYLSGTNKQKSSKRPASTLSGQISITPKSELSGFWGY